MEKATYKDIRPYLLADILETYFVGTKEEVDIKRSYVITYNGISDMFLAGSCGDGFDRLTSDTDVLIEDRTGIALNPDLFEYVNTAETSEYVYLVRKNDCRPGYVNIQVAHFGQYIDQVVFNSLVPVDNALYLSSDIFREEIMAQINCDGVKGETTGPSNKLAFIERAETGDTVRALPCISWPSDADEWCYRPRVFGWPTEVMVKDIVKNGCHLVPVGDKCSEDTLLQWRLSFTTAERYLIHSFNHTQFSVYGLLKYILKQIKPRILQGTGDGEILCSYHIKTLMLYLVENSPQSLWQRKNIFVCFWLCFTTLLDWVHAGYCPNYFIPVNNMFERKINGENKLKLLKILSELHQMKWASLSVRTYFELPSIWELLQIPLSLEHLLHNQTSAEQECRRDFEMYRCMGYHHESSDTAEKLIKSVKALSKSRSDVEEIFIYDTLVCLLCSSSIRHYQESNDNTGNKNMYRSLRKYEYRLATSFGTDLLYLATFYYNIGNYKKSLKLCRDISSSVYLYYDSTKDKERYRDVYCGRNLSLIQKIKEAFSRKLMFRLADLQFCLPQLHSELLAKHPHPMFITPQPYSRFLAYLCCESLGDKDGCNEALRDLEAVNYDEDQGGEKYAIIHLLLGICYEIRGDKQSAIMAYQDSLNVCADWNSALDRINNLKTSESACT